MVTVTASVIAPAGTITEVPSLVVTEPPSGEIFLVIVAGAFDCPPQPTAITTDRNNPIAKFTRMGSAILCQFRTSYLIVFSQLGQKVRSVLGQFLRADARNTEQLCRR